MYILVARVTLILSQMETATIPNEDFHSATNEGGSGPTTYSRGYQPLLQEDPEISYTHDPKNTAPQPPVGMQTLPPNYTETQSSQYTPAPQSFNPQQQSSSVRKICCNTSKQDKGGDHKALLYNPSCHIYYCTNITMQQYYHGICLIPTFHRET